MSIQLYAVEVLAIRAADSADPNDTLSAHCVAPKNFSVAFKLYDFGVTFSEDDINQIILMIGRQSTKIMSC